MLRYVTLLFLCILIFSGCAGREIKIIDPAGRLIPTPHYLLMSTGDLQIQTVSYWAKFKQEKDLDGSLILQPIFIPFTEDYKFSMKKYSHVSLTLEIRNPKRVEYKIIEKYSSVGKSTEGVKYNRRVVGVSDIEYRQFVINLPFCIEDIGKIQYGVDLVTNDEMPIMHFGNLNYVLTK